MNPIRITLPAIRPNAFPHSPSRHRLRNAALLLPLVIGLQGCSALTHYNDTRAVAAATEAKSELILMDAKQRVVFPTNHEFRDDAGKVTATFRAFCAEPSPDALSALAAQFGASISIATKGEGSLTGGLAESAANIGLRTASIQTLRDSMYRQCEAFANGGMSRLSLETLQRRFQSTMVALLAIEQLTGAVRGPAVVLNGATASSNAEAVASLTRQTEVARSELAQAEADVAAKKATAATAEATSKSLADKAKTDASQKEAAAAAEKDAVAARKALADAQTVADNRKQAFEAIDASRRASLTAGGTATTGGSTTFAPATGGLNAAAAASVSTAVTDIVRDTLALGYGREVCTSIIGEAVEVTTISAKLFGANGSANDVRTVCLDLLKKDISFYEALERRMDAQTGVTKAVSSLIDRCAKDPKCPLVPDQIGRLVESIEAQATVTPPLTMPLMVMPKPETK